MRGSGGTEGGIGQFALGFGLAVLALYLFFDSVRVSTAPRGALSMWLQAQDGVEPGLWETTSLGLLFVPFFLGVLALFYDARMKWAWGLMWCGLAVLAIEILSRIRFLMSMKLTHFLGMVALFAAGAALMIRSYHDASEGRKPPADGAKQNQA